MKTRRLDPGPTRASATNGNTGDLVTPATSLPKPPFWSAGTSPLPLRLLPPFPHTLMASGEQSPVSTAYSMAPGSPASLWLEMILKHKLGAGPPPPNPRDLSQVPPMGLLEPPRPQAGGAPPLSDSFLPRSPLSLLTVTPALLHPQGQDSVLLGAAHPMSEQESFV